MKPEYDSKSTDDPELAKELTLQVRKVIGPFAAPKKIVSLFVSISFLGRETNHLFYTLCREMNHLFYTLRSVLLPLSVIQYSAKHRLGRTLTLSTSSPTYPRPEVERSCDESYERSFQAKAINWAICHPWQTPIPSRKVSPLLLSPVKKRADELVKTKATPKK